MNSESYKWGGLNADRARESLERLSSLWANISSASYIGKNMVQAHGYPETL